MVCGDVARADLPLHHSNDAIRPIASRDLPTNPYRVRSLVMYDFYLLASMWRERVERQDAEHRNNVVLLSATAIAVVIAVVGCLV